jgi:hypothetical protein
MEATVATARWPRAARRLGPAPVMARQVAVKPISVKIRLPLECEAWTSIL